MKKVEVYKLDNGELIENGKEALQRDLELKCNAKIDKLCEDLMTMTYNMDASDVAGIIKENRCLFKDACGGK